MVQSTPPDRLNQVLTIVTRNLAADQIPFALIGALALGFYGLPQFTADIDLMTEGRFWAKLHPIMKRLGYTCSQKTDIFAQFESELGVLGYVDFLLVNTPDGKAILERRVEMEDRLLGRCPVVQPTDYLVLKIMAVANNPGRSARDEADIAAFFDLRQHQQIPDVFEPLVLERIRLFADRFGQRGLIEKYFTRLKPGEGGGQFEL